MYMYTNIALIYQILSLKIKLSKFIDVRLL